MILNDSEKHRVIYKFFPNLRGHLLHGEDLEGYFIDAVRRAERKGWSEQEIVSSAKTKKWKKPGRLIHPSTANE